MNEPLEQSQVSDSSSQLVFTLVFSHFDPSSSSLPPPLAELYFLSGRLQTVAVVVPASTTQQSCTLSALILLLTKKIHFLLDGT